MYPVLQYGAAVQTKGYKLTHILYPDKVLALAAQMRRPPETPRGLLQAIAPHLVLFVPNDPLRLLTSNEDTGQSLEVGEWVHGVWQLARAWTMRVDRGGAGRGRSGK
jgi:hypothetical protein